MKINYSLLLLFVASIAIFSFSSNPPNGRTGAPGEGTCAGCHNPPGSTTLDGSMDITGLPNTVIAGNTYTVTVAVNNPALNAVRAGFQMVALDEANTNTGTMTNPSSSSTIANSGGKDYHEHAPAVNFSGNPSVTWTVDWTAPANGTYADGDSLFLYGSSIIANGGGSGNDLTRLTSLRVDIENPPAPPVSLAVTNIVDALCSDSSDGQATAEITGGTAPFDIVWDNGEMGMNATMLSPGMHSVTVTDALNEMDDATFEILAPTAITVSNEIITNESCIGECDGSIAFDLAGGTAPYSISIDGAVTTIPITDLCIGTYIVDITDANNCTIQLEYTILPPAAITINNPVIFDATCNGGSDGSIFINTAGGTGTLMTSWSNGDSGNNITNLIAGDYTATVIDANNCIYQETFTVGEADSLEVTIIESEPIPCFGLFGTLAISENFNSYNWSNGVLDPVNAGIPAGTYSVTVMDANGCTGEASYELGQPDEITLDFDITNISMGGDGEISVIPSGGTAPYMYLWSTSDADSTITNLNEGTYTVTVSDSNNCTEVESVQLTSDCTLEITSTNSTPITCNGGSDGTATIEYSGTILDSLEINWSNGDTSLMITDLVSGDYSVTISDGGNCAVETTITVSQPDPIEIDIQVITFPSSETSMDGSITATATGGTGPNYIFDWNAGTGNTLFDIGVGKYKLWVVDENGCSATDSIQLTVAVCDYELSVTSTEDLCPGDMTGVASVKVTGGTNVVTTWSTDETGDMITDLGAGDYFVAAIDSADCVDTVFFSIAESSIELDILDTLYSPINCEDTLGSIQIILGDLNGPFTYSWSNGDTTNLADSLLAGTYTLTITNANGCSTEISLETEENFTDEITYDVTEVSIYLDENGNAPANMEGISNLMGSCEDSLYVLYNDNTFDCSDIGPGLDTVDIYNFDEVAIEDVVIIYTVYDTIPPVYNCPMDTTFNEENGFTACGGGIIFYDMVIPGDSIKDNCTVFADTTITVSFSYDTTGFYDFTFEILDECGNSTTCTIVREFVVFAPPVVDIEVTHASCFGASDGCVEIDIIEGIPPFFIIPENICELGAGTYDIEVIDSTGCSAFFDVTITQPEEIVIIETDKGGETPGQSDGFIDVTVTGGSGPYTFEWTENGEVVSNLEDLINFPSSQYELTVTDSLGCTQILSTFIDMADNTFSEAFAQIKIYPNPFDDVLIIEGVSDINAKIELFNILGQKIDVSVNNNSKQNVIFTNELTDGMYLVKVSLDNEFKTFKITK